MAEPNLPLTHLSGGDEDDNTVTFGWVPSAEADGYKFTSEKSPKGSHTWDGSRKTVVFRNDSKWYKVEELRVQRSGVMALKGSGTGNRTFEPPEPPPIEPPPTEPPPTGPVIDVVPGQLATKILAASAGQTLRLLSGTHPQVTLSKSFAEPRLRIIAATGAVSQGIISNGQSGYTFDGITITRPFSSNIDDSCFYFVGASSRIKITNCKLSGACITCKFYVASPNWISDCEVSECDISAGWDCIHVNGAKNLTLFHNYLHDNHIVSGGHHDGVQVTRGQDIFIIRNRIKNTALISDSQGILIGEPGEPLSNVWIVNNLVGPLGASGGTGIMVCHSTGARVVNNTCVDTTKHGFNVQPVHGPIVDCQVWNNIFKSPFFDAPYNVPGGNIAYYAHNWFIDPQGGSTGDQRGSSYTTGDPQLGGQPEYVPDAGSPVRNLGINRPGTPTVDRDGQARPAAVGLGCQV